MAPHVRGHGGAGSAAPNVHCWPVAMSNAALSFTPDAATIDMLSADDAFRGRILAAVRDLRAREKRVSSPHVAVTCDLRLGDAANDSADESALQA